MPDCLIEVGSTALRCAIYTRKSTEEGLDQSFNSLDAQREACESYILSQRHERWLCLPNRYDDGGFSGGTMDRPALKRLLSDIAAGKVDVVVIYKIDRLSRSLSDFARIVEVFERSDASFVSVTQAFSTATSTGRLTLNMLLSFAQFERELGAERVRDKIAASKRKGMWMGGVCPLGFDVKDRALVVNETEAATVRRIFDLYCQLGSVLKLEVELRKKRIHSKWRVSRRGRVSGGKPFSRGALYVLLRNVLYLGRVAHRGNVYPGQHRAIVDATTFDRVQAMLDERAPARRTGSIREKAPLLAGLVVDSNGYKLSPTHTTKGTRRYRYYATKQGTGAGSEPPALRVPAGELESLVVARLQEFLADARAIHDALESREPSASELESALARAGELGQLLNVPNTKSQDGAVSVLVSEVVVAPEEIAIGVSIAPLLANPVPLNGSSTVQLNIPVRLGRRTREVRLMVPPPRGTQSKDPGLIKLIVRAYEARRAFESADGQSIERIAQSCGFESGYFLVLVKLGYLAPDIVESILEGSQAPELTRQHLARIRALPHCWDEQRRMLGFEVGDLCQGLTAPS